MASLRMACDRRRWSRCSRVAARLRRSRDRQTQADLRTGAHGKRQGRFVHGEQSQVAWNGPEQGRMCASAGGAAMTPGKAKFEIKLGAATREAFGKALAELGRENRNVVALDADLSKSTFTSLFQKEFPERFI